MSISFLVQYGSLSVYVCLCESKRERERASETEHSVFDNSNKPGSIVLRKKVPRIGLFNFFPTAGFLSSEESHSIFALWDALLKVYFY